MIRCSIITVVVFGLCTAGFAATIHVPGDYSTIQAAIDAASSGDTVLVAAGLYAPSTNGEVYPIQLSSRSGITLLADGDVILDCEGSIYDNLLYIYMSDNIHVEGFTFQYAERRGLYCRSSQEVYVKDCLFLDNDEGSLSSAWSTIYLFGNELKNTMPRDANGISGYETQTVACYNIIHGFHTTNFWNVTGIGLSADDPPSTGWVEGNIVYDNDCGIWGNDTEMTIINNTVHDNLPLSPSSLKGRGIAFGPSNETLTITNNIVTRNPNDGIHLYQVPNHTISYNNVWGNAYMFGNEYDGCSPGVGDISVDPQYLDPALGDFHLVYTSPCRDAGDNSAAGAFDFEGDPRIGWGGTVDMGADEFYTHLYITGDQTPGSRIHAKFVGMPATTPVGVFIGSGVRTTPASTPYGDFWLLPPKLLIPLIPIPANGILDIQTIIPLTPPAPYDLPMQGLIGLTPESLTNLCVLEVR